MAIPLINRGSVALKESDSFLKERKLKFALDKKVNPLLRDVLKLRVPKIKLKKGVKLKDVGVSSSIELYIKIFYTLVKLVFRDLLDGKIVYFQKCQKSFFYIHHMPISQESIMFGRKPGKHETPAINLKVTNYTKPVVVLDTGYTARDVRPCLVRIPPDMYTELVNSVNSGKKYIRPVNANSFSIDAEQKDKNEKWREYKNKIRFRL